METQIKVKDSSGKCFSPLAGKRLMETSLDGNKLGEIWRFSPLAGKRLMETPSASCPLPFLLKGFSPLAGKRLMETN